MKEDGKDKTWKDRTGRKYQSYGVEQRLEKAKPEKHEEGADEVKSIESIPLPPEENETKRDTANTQESTTTEVDLEEEEGEDIGLETLQESRAEESKNQMEEGDPTPTFSSSNFISN